MRVYPWVAWYSARRYAAYPLSALAEALTNIVFGFVKAAILIALWRVRPHLGGYDLTDAVTFCFIAQMLMGPVQIFGGLPLAERIRSGDVAIDLHRPADLQAWWLADDLGRALCALPLRGGPPLLAGTLAFDLRLPGSPGIAAFCAAMLLGIVVSFGLRYLVAISVFWLHDDRGIQAVALVLSLFFSGMIVPLVLFPGPLGTVARSMPWSALIQVPADVFLGRAWVPGALAFQAGWAVVLLGLGRLLTLAAGRRLVIHGG